MYKEWDSSDPTDVQDRILGKISAISSLCMNRPHQLEYVGTGLIQRFGVQEGGVSLLLSHGN
jgi:hypothetical protein